jgi:trimeric autotransporter adhesin
VATFELSGGSSSGGGGSGSTWLTGTVAPTSGVGDDGDFYIDTVSGIFYFKSSGTWAPIISVISSINALTARVQTLVPGVFGTDFNIDSTGSTHNFNFPSASAVNRGLLTPSDWTTFNAKLSAIPNTAVTPGTYTNTSLTVGADGRLTAASTGNVNLSSGIYEWNNFI